jgi:hypothetical protein
MPRLHSGSVFPSADSGAHSVVAAAAAAAAASGDEGTDGSGRQSRRESFASAPAAPVDRIAREADSEAAQQWRRERTSILDALSATAQLLLLFQLPLAVAATLADTHDWPTGDLGPSTHHASLSGAAAAAASMGSARARAGSISADTVLPAWVRAVLRCCEMPQAGAALVGTCAAIDALSHAHQLPRTVVCALESPASVDRYFLAPLWSLLPISRSAGALLARLCAASPAAAAGVARGVAARLVHSELRTEAARRFGILWATAGAQLSDPLLWAPAMFLVIDMLSDAQPGPRFAARSWLQQAFMHVERYVIKRGDRRESVSVEKEGGGGSERENTIDRARTDLCITGCLIRCCWSWCGRHR